LLLILGALAVVDLPWLSREAWFVEHPFPNVEADRVFDVGIVDANGDDILDVFTSNHHFRQALLIADGKGGYRDTLSQWGLDQSSEFPLAELSFAAPSVNEPGIYVYWLGTNLVVQAHKVAGLGRWQGTLEVYDPLTVKKQEGFQVIKKEARLGEATHTVLEFAVVSDGLLVLTPNGQGLPLNFDFRDSIAPGKIFVGRAGVSPVGSRFSLAMQDRHAHAWADYNGDGLLDVFINRGGLGGALLAYPDHVVQTIKDELFLSHGPGKFEEVGLATGIQKKGCSGRHASWLDFDGDGLLDLFVNCYDRQRLAADFPKQLYRQTADGQLTDVAEAVGLGLPAEQMGSIAWFDVEGDGDIDLLAFQDEGIVLYRNDGNSFGKELVFARTTAEGEKVGHTTESAWLFDGKLSAADFDGDGDMDLFSASKRGNLVLENHGGRFSARELGSLRLPDRSMTANWVDFDNDGLMDLHLVPQGLYRQRPDRRFDETGMLAVNRDRYRAAIANWFDLDNDGRPDLLMALDEHPQPDRPEKHKGRWQLVMHRNAGATGNWLQLKLVGGAGNRQAIGARVTLATPSGQQTSEVGASEGSFFSQGHHRLYFGLGKHARAETVAIRWPDGSRQELHDVDGGRLLTVQQEVRTQAPLTSSGFQKRGDR
jgi:hypothetical protein